ncbi:MAG: HIT domain-containing protein [Actinomycetota bacterium]|nr:HIT domain-containing protein [Actinomycetota bacterium]
MKFLQNEGEPDHLRAPSSCVLCDLGKGGGEGFDIEHYVLLRASQCYVVLNAFPYAAGHLMIVPYAHEGDLLNLGNTELAESLELTRVAIGVLKEIYNPEGFNFGANLGRAGGAAFGDHVHFHVVPRWLGDTNFMTTLAHTRVIPEALPDTYKRMKAYFKAI